ncbi:putative LRR receptor-like serine/threonine-protein kinase [Nymphaea thermarum]|nr:putative LRR receptor-like serine/threonine-protein kinase [Nymphaea thermarum]
MERASPPTMRIIFLVLLFVPYLSALAQLPSQDILSLLQFKKEVKIDPSGSIFNSWNEESIDFNGCPSSWYGIICSGNSVAGIVLNNLNLSANSDLSVFANLAMLITLSLSNNSISGQLSSSIGSLRKLQYLDVSNNLFSGSLPSEIGHLHSLKNLSLSGNAFSGPIPGSLGGLTSIQSVDLSSNSFSGALTMSPTKLIQLVSLNLSCNNLTGNIPAGLIRLQNLKMVDFHQNQFSNVITEGFFLLSTATYIDLSDNLLSRSSSSKGFLSGLSGSLQYLNLSKNKITGSLIEPGDLPLMGELKVLDLSHNQLSGELPAFQFAYALEVLRLRGNGFSGSLPSGLIKGDSLVLTELDLSSNNLSGPISMITSTTLQVLNLSSNAISGELPLLTGICTILDLSNNQFTGNLSVIAKWGNNLEFVDLSENKLSGPFPELTSQFLRLNYLNVSHNLLIGSLPSVLSEYPKLSILDLSDNRFDGPVLYDLLSSPTLQEIHLHNNLFIGGIPFTSSSMNNTHLRVLDLSMNRLSGALPLEIDVLTNLKELNIAGNTFSGNLPASVTKLSSLVSLDMSSNQFTGPLPDSFPQTLQSFNVSYNDFTGVVPVNLRKFPDSSFHPGNENLELPYSSSGPNPNPGRRGHHKQINALTKAVVIIACVVAFTIIVLLAIVIHYKRISKTRHTAEGSKVLRSSAVSGPASLVVSADELVASRSRKGSPPPGILSPDEKKSAASGGDIVGFYSPSKNSQFSWSPGSGGSSTPEHLGKLKVHSPDRLAGELYFLDDSLTFTPEELSRAPAEVLGRSSHGTSYRAALDNGVFLTVKWLREGVAKPRKEFAKEAKKFSNIRHPNVVGLRGYYWGPSQHEKLILSDYVVPGSLASFLYDRPTRKGPPLTWNQRLKVAVDVARGLNYLHFDRALPHGNLKSTNILLEGPDLNARVADYCLHRLMTQSGTAEQILDAGVLGYRAPELAAAKKPVPSFKSDVYSFGVVLLELLTGRCAGDVVSSDQGGVDLTDWVRSRAENERFTECFDPAIVTESGNSAAGKGMQEMLGIALRCIRPVSERPGIKSVYEDLSSI